MGGAAGGTIGQSVGCGCPQRRVFKPVGLVGWSQVAQVPFSHFGNCVSCQDVRLLLKLT